MTVEQMKALPRTEEGIFDLSGLDTNPYKAAMAVYPAYAEYETNENKKEGYPDIMAQMRVWNRKIKADFNFTDAAVYIAMLLGTVESVSPEIYENYRELLDMFREAVKKVLDAYYDAESDTFSGDADTVKIFCDAVRRACDKHLLLAEKYQMCLC